MFSRRALTIMWLCGGLGLAACSLTGDLDDVTGGQGGATAPEPECASDGECAHLTDPCNEGRCDAGSRTCSAVPRVDLPCDDDEACTHGDLCDASGQCHGTAYSCTSSHECVTSSCDGTGACTEELQSGFCLIGSPTQECYAEHDPDPAAPCAWCDPATSTTSWTQMPVDSECLPGGDPCLEGSCNAAGTCVYVGYQPLETPCEPAPGDCELQDTCDGAGLCVDRGLEANTTECRPSVGPCDVSEFCTGSGPTCPHDAKEPAGTDCGTCRTCNDSGACLTNSSDHLDCGDCEVCADGACAPQGAGEDVKDRCLTFVCTDYVWGGSGLDCYAYAASTAINGGCDGTGSCADVIESCQTEGALIASCANAACVNCTPGELIVVPIEAACHTYGLQTCPDGQGCDGTGNCVDIGGSCPFLYTWDGADFAFETDLFGSGKLGVELGTGFWRPTPDDYYVLANEPVELGGSLELRLVEERAELNYLDAVSMVAIDVPDGYDVATELHGLGTPYVSLQDSIHTLAVVRQPPVAALHLQNSGSPPSVSILSEIAQADGVFAVLGNDRNLDFEYETIELDLGDMSAAPQIKLVIDARTAFPISAAGIARKKLFGAPSRLEVLDGGGQWVEVPRSVAKLANPKEAKRPFVLDITNIFLTSTYEVRLTWLFKTYVDAISVDATLDLQPALQTLTLASADLHYYGHSLRVGGEIFEFQYGSISQHVPDPFVGYFTSYGNVLPLLEQVDDMFVIFWGGDEVTMRFAPLPAPAAGMTRRYVLHSNGYYKDRTYSGPHTVEPLPFAAMSNYPYPDPEHYPNDFAHKTYRDDFNTRYLP